MRKIGVFVCWCGINISRTVDVEEVTREALDCPGVVHAEDYRYMCSRPGQQLITDAIEEKGLDGVVVAACSPSMHEPTFRETVKEAGLNPYQMRMANIREQCSWVHDDRDEATNKALDIVRSRVEKVKRDRPLQPLNIDVSKKVLVLGGGIAGMQAALDIGDAGYPVVLVEKEPNIGGRMAQLSETFPTLDCASCILTPKMAEVQRHPQIDLLAYSELTGLDGYVGNFTAEITRKPTYVDWDECVGCMMCQESCPQEVVSDFERGMGNKKAVGMNFPQAVPNRAVVDSEHCLHLDQDTPSRSWPSLQNTTYCGICEQTCPAGAIDFQQQETVIEERVGAIVVATGYDVLETEEFGEYGYGKYPDVIDSLAFERLLSSSGPTQGELKRPSDGKTPEEVVFIQCVGSRDPEQGMPYCSKICCMYTAKHATLYKHKVPEGQPYIFHMDVRAGGKGYEEFVQHAQEEEEALYLRGRVSKVYPDNGKMTVKGVDTLSGENVEIEADLVVLATAIVPKLGGDDLARLLKAGTDEHGFYTEAHPKLRPIESMTRGVYLAGAVQAPRDITDTVAQASGTASKVAALFSEDYMEVEPIVAAVDEQKCSGCMWCLPVCPYDAIEEKSVEVDGAGQRTQIAEVNTGLCQGCGACVVACRDGAMRLEGYRDEQILAEVEALCL